MEEGKSDVFILAGEKIFIGISIPAKRSFYIKWQADVERGASLRTQEIAPHRQRLPSVPRQSA